MFFYCFVNTIILSICDLCLGSFHGSCIILFLLVHLWTINLLSVFGICSSNWMSRFFWSLKLEGSLGTQKILIAMENVRKAVSFLDKATELGTWLSNGPISGPPWLDEPYCSWDSGTFAVVSSPLFGTAWSTMSLTFKFPIAVSGTAIFHKKKLLTHQKCHY